MSRRRNRLSRDERGATLVLVALSMFLLLGMAALAVDMSAAFAWRSEAQKIADAAALAGGSAFLDFQQSEAEPYARSRAYAYAIEHTLKGVKVDSSEVTVQVIPADYKVRVWINRTDMPTWFANILGFNGVDIGAMAAAQASGAGTAKCLKPFALPDMWDDVDDDMDGNDIWTPDEDWQFGSDEADRYQRYDGPDATYTNGPPTGYGSEFRGTDRDYGRSIQLKAADPNDPYNFTPGIFFPWRLPIDEDQASCDSGGGGGGSTGGAVYRRNICECNDSQIDLFTPYDLEPGNMIGPTFQGISELLDEDPDVYWEPSANGGKGGPVRPLPGGGWEYVGEATPRVIKIALFAPGQIQSSGMQSIEFNNFALMFLQDMPGQHDAVQAKFMYWAQGTGGPSTGTLVRQLRIVE